MAVYTEVSRAEAAALVAHLGLGELTGLSGIHGGIENTNYFADTTHGQFVLTVFERLNFEQLPFYLRLMKHLAERGIPVPEPMADGRGEIVHTVRDKPAAVVNRLRGEHRLLPDECDCRLLGTMLARMHMAGADFPLQQPNLRGLDWCLETAALIEPYLSPTQCELLDEELKFQQQVAASAAFAALPRGPIHGDLFRDNAMFDSSPTGVELTGLFDFYFASVDTLLFDIAVCLNDWCIDLTTGRLDESRATALVRAYDAVRPLHSGEWRLLPAQMRAAALRFWVSRLWDLHLPRDASLLTAHDPTHFERVLRERVNAPWHATRTSEA